MSTPTIVFVRHGQVGSRQFQFGEELPPDSLPRETIDRWLDEKWLVECEPTDRRSLYRLLPRFSGCSESQPLSAEERGKFCLQE